jgi:hypothetical protein
LPIKFESKDCLENYVLEIDFQILGVDNVFISTANFMLVESNSILLLNKEKKMMGEIEFQTEEKAINFFNFSAFLLNFQVIFKDKFAKKIET